MDGNSAYHRPFEKHGIDKGHFLNWVARSSYETKFIVTGRGYMGLAPRTSRIDDICAIVFGCTTSCILRKTNPESQYQYIGAAVLIGSQQRETRSGGTIFRQLGDETSEDWTEWDVEEQDIELCLDVARLFATSMHEPLQDLLRQLAYTFGWPYIV